MGKDSAAQIELGRSLHQEGTVNEKVCESDFFCLCIIACILVYALNNECIFVFFHINGWPAGWKAHYK